MLNEYHRDEAMLHFQRGVVLERAHRVQEAVEEYRRAIARYPHLREAHDALGFYYQRYGLLAKAAEEFRVVANLEDDFLSNFNLGYVLFELGRHDDALIAFQRCLTIVPDDPATHYEIACISFLKGEYQGALEHLRLPLQDYAEDWELHKLFGRCKLRLGCYDEALSAFHRAQQLTQRPAAQADLASLIAAAERYYELGAVACVKDQLYAEHGVVHLGSSQDNGLHLGEEAEYHFTYPDIAITVSRLLALLEAHQWQFTCVVALDRLAQPLACALAALLDVEQRAAGQIKAGDRPLMVLAIGRESELLELAIERAPMPVVTFCLGLNWLRRRAMLPDISGVVVRGACSVPWESELRRMRADGAQQAQIERCLQHAAEQIITAARDITADAPLAEQIEYYTQRYHRLRFANILSSQ